METALSAGVRCMTPLLRRFAALLASDGCMRVPAAIAARHTQASMCAHAEPEAQALSLPRRHCAQHAGSSGF